MKVGSQRGWSQEENNLIIYHSKQRADGKILEILLEFYKAIDLWYIALVTQFRCTTIVIFFWDTMMSWLFDSYENNHSWGWAVAISNKAIQA